MKVDQLLEHLQQQVNYNQHIDVQKNTPSPPCSTPTEQHVNGHLASSSRASSSSISPPNDSLAQQSNILTTDWATAFMRQHMLGQFSHLSSLFQRENINEPCFMFPLEGEKVELLHTSKIGSQMLALTDCPTNPESHCYEWTFANGRFRTDGTEHITFLCAACRSLRSRKKVANNTPLPSLVAIRGIDKEIWWSGKGNGKMHCCAGSKKKADITTRAIKRSLTAKLCLRSTKQTKVLMKKFDADEDQNHFCGALTPLTNVSPANPLLTEHTVFRSNPTTARPIKLENSKIAIAEVPEHLINQGLSAVGGCRQCSKTFTDRLELIHHFCDHFPAIFYSFEELKLGEKNDLKDNNNKQAICTEAAENRQKKAESSVLSTDTMDQGVVSTLEPSTNNVDPTEVYALMQQLTSYNNLFDSNSSFNSTFQAATTSSSPMMSLASVPAASTHYLANISQSQNTFMDNNLASKHLISKKKKKSSSHKLDKSHSNSTSASSFTGEQTKPITCISNDYSEQSKGGVTPHRPVNTSTNQCGSSNSQDLPYHMCPHCCLTFAELQPFQDHLQTHLTINTLAESGSGFGSPFGFNDPSHQPKLIKCRFCDMRFGNTYRLAEHEKLHAQNCCRCNKIFMTVFDLNLHMGTHTGYTYDCKDCGKCFPCRKTLAEHNRSHRILLSTSSDDNSLSTPQVPTSSAGIKSFSVATSLSNYSTISENPTPLFCLDFSAENSKKEASKKTREVSFPTVANPTMEDLNNRRPESLFNSNPYFTELLSQNGQTTRKRRSRMGNSKRANGEKSRKQTTLVAVELNPHELIGSDGIPMATAITTNIQELQVKKENEYHTETSKKIEKN